MSYRPSNALENEFIRLHGVKKSAARPSPTLGPELISFFKKSVEKRQTKMGQIGQSWAQLVPETLLQHCSLESYTRGGLTVLVDSSSHLYELKQLLLAGLEQQLHIACKSSGLRKITLRPGRWYDGELGDGKARFD